MPQSYSFQQYQDIQIATTMNENQTKEKPEDKVFHYQLATDHRNTKLLRIYHISLQRYQAHKSMIIHQDDVMWYRTIFHKRQKLYYEFRDMKGFKRNVFSQEIMIKEHKQFEKQVPKHIIFEIRQPFFDGVNLAYYIIHKNSKLQSVFTYFTPIFFELVNLLIRIDRESLLIPSFRTVLVKEKNNEVKLNFFSFTGIELYQNNLGIQGSRVMQILSFFPSSNKHQEKKGISLQRALAVLLLGLLIGKQINLYPQKVIKQDRISRSAFMELAEGNKQKYTKILKTKTVNRLLDQLEKQHNITLKSIFNRILIEEEQVSWSEFKRQIFDEDPKKAKITVGSDENQHQVSINQFIRDLGQKKWQSLQLSQKEKVLRNKLLKIQSVDDELDEQDAEMLLIYCLKIDLNVLKPYTTLVDFLDGCQDPNICKFDCETMQLRDKFMPQLLNYKTAIPKSIPNLAATLKQNRPEDSPGHVGDNTDQQSTRPHKLFTTYGPKDKPLSVQQQQMAYLQLWTEPQVFKFMNKHQKKGQTSTDRLTSLRQFSKCFFIDDDEDDDAV